MFAEQSGDTVIEMDERFGRRRDDGIWVDHSNQFYWDQGIADWAPIEDLIIPDVFEDPFLDDELLAGRHIKTERPGDVEPEHVEILQPTQPVEYEADVDYPMSVDPRPTAPATPAVAAPGDAAKFFLAVFVAGVVVGIVAMVIYNRTKSDDVQITTRPHETIASTAYTPETEQVTSILAGASETTTTTLLVPRRLTTARLPERTSVLANVAPTTTMAVPPVTTSTTSDISATVATNTSTTEVEETDD